MVSEARRASFLKSVGTVAIGTAVSQVLLLAATPLLTRLYSPDDFGVFAAYTGIVALLAVIATGRYEVAIPLPKARDAATSLVALAGSVAGAFSLAALAMVWLFRTSIADIFDAPALERWLWFVPLSVLLIAAYQTLSYWSTRQSQFSNLSTSRVWRTVSTLAAQLGVAGGGRTPGPGGLIGGQVAGSALGTAVLALRVRRSSSQPLEVGWDPAAMRWVAREYRDLPKHAVTTSFLNTASSTSVPLLVAGLLGPVGAGLVLLGQRVVVVPIQLFGQAIWQVTHSRLGILDSSAGSQLIVTLHRYVCFLYALPLAAAALFAPLAGTVFGDQWEPLGRLLPPFAVMAYLNAVSNAASYFAAFGEYRAESVANVSLAVLRIGALLIASVYFDLTGVVIAYTAASSFVYLVIIYFWARRLASMRVFFSNMVMSMLTAGALLVPIRFIAADNLLGVAVAAFIVTAGYYVVLGRAVRRNPVLSVGSGQP